MEEAIRSILQEAGVGFTTNSKSFILTCPRCSKPEKLYMLKQTGRFVCWVCRETEGFQGRPEFALAELVGRPVQAIRAQLYDLEAEALAPILDSIVADFVGGDDDIILLEPEAEELISVDWPEDSVALDGPDTAGADYLWKRGVPLSVALQYDIRWWPKRKQVLFPVKSQGRLLGWQGRLIEGTDSYQDPVTQKWVTPPKIITSKGLRGSRSLMFFDRLQGQKHAVLCEGPMDALKAHLCGGNVASMGKAVSRIQLQLLRNAGIEKLYIALDPDAQEEANRIARNPQGMQIFNMTAPKPYKDLGEMPFDAVRELFLTARRMGPGDLFLDFTFKGF
jgi:hypothetical protein